MLFKIRCSQIGKIMTGEIGLTETQEKEYYNLFNKDSLTEKQAEKLKALDYKMNNPELSQTAKSYIEQWLKEQIYKTKYSFSSKYTEKGNINEDESIDFAAKMLKYGMLVKNDECFENDFIIGTPDVITNDTILDLKNSWDCFTFPLFSKDIPNKEYMYQLQGYMSLKGFKKARLVYVLTDTPMHIIEREAYYYCKNNGYDELDMDILKLFIDKMTYKNISDDLKIKVFDIEYDQDIINEVNKRVLMCRKYIDTLL